MESTFSIVVTCLLLIRVTARLNLQERLKRICQNKCTYLGRLWSLEFQQLILSKEIALVSNEAIQ